MSLVNLMKCLDGDPALRKKLEIECRIEIANERRRAAPVADGEEEAASIDEGVE